MCLLIVHDGDHSDPDNILHDTWLQDFFSRNRDGFGFMYNKDGQFITERALGKVDDFIAAWRRVEALNVPFACHLRMRTHGDINMENVHPYKILGPESGNEVAIMHNGILSCGNTSDTTKSDTWHFANHILKPMIDPEQGRSPDVIFTPEFQYLLSEAVGQSNRLAIMDDKGRLAITRKSGWTQWGNMLFSNTYAWSASDAGITTALYGTEKDKSSRKKAKDKRNIPAPVTYTYRGGAYNDPDRNFFQKLKAAKLDLAHKDLYYKDSIAFFKVFTIAESEKLILLAEYKYITEDEFILAVQTDYALAREFLKLSPPGETEDGVSPDSKSVVDDAVAPGTSGATATGQDPTTEPSRAAQDEAATQADLQLEYAEATVPSDGVLYEIYTLFGVKRQLGELYREELVVKGLVNSSTSSAIEKQNGIARVAEIIKQREPMFGLLTRLKAIDKQWKEEDKQLKELDNRLDRYLAFDTTGHSSTVIAYNAKRIEDTEGRIAVLTAAMARRSQEPMITVPLTEGA